VQNCYTDEDRHQFVTQLVVSGTNGIANAPYLVLASTNVMQPLVQWSRIATNLFDSMGGFVFSNALGHPRCFYALQLP